MADGYGVGLFDSAGPKAFAAEVKNISTNLTEVQKSFQGLGTAATQSLTNISAAVDALIAKLGQVQTGIGGAVPQGGPAAGPQWNNPPQPNSGTGEGAPMAGMPQNTANTGGQSFTGMQQGTASIGQRAVQSMVPAAIGAATTAAGGMVGTAIQGATIGAIYGPAGNVSGRSLYQQPAGTFATNMGDYAQANYYGIQNLGVAPGTQNWSTILGSGNSSANFFMQAIPGTSRLQAAGDIGSMMSPQTMNMALVMGVGNWSPGGVMQGAGQDIQQLWQRLTRNYPGGMPSAADVAQNLRPGGTWDNFLSYLGMGQGTPGYTAFVNYAYTAVGMANKGQGMPAGGGIQGTPLANNAYTAQLQAQTNVAGLQQQFEPGIAAGATALNRTAGGILGTGGMLGGAVNAAGSGLAIYGGIKMAKKVGGSMASKIGDLFKGGGGAGATAGETAAADAAPEAVAGGLEAAGLASDATVVGAPVGLALGAAGLAVGAYGMRHQIGHFFSGLFGGGGKKKTTAAPDGTQATAGGVSGDMASLLAAAPPQQSLLACLTTQIKPTDKTLISYLVNPAPSTGGGGGGAGGPLGTQAAALWGKTSTTSTGGSGNTGGSGGGQAVAATAAPVSGSAAQNQALGQQMAAAMGWTGAEWTALNNVEMAEGGWNPNAQNPTSPAYGIAQFIGGAGEYPQYGGDASTVKGQITGFLNYVKQRYTTPSKAWQHEQQYGWYARGSQLIDRTQLAVLHRGEAVIPAADNYSSSPYNKNGASGGASVIQLNFKPGSIVLQVPPSSTQQDMDNLANQFVAAVSKPAVLAAVRSS